MNITMLLEMAASGFGDRVAFFHVTELSLVRCVLQGEHSVVGKATEHLLVPLRFGEPSRAFARAVDAEGSHRLVVSCE